MIEKWSSKEVEPAKSALDWWAEQRPWDKASATNEVVASFCHNLRTCPTEEIDPFLSLLMARLNAAIERRRHDVHRVR
jgi:hypothetical protein